MRAYKQIWANFRTFLKGQEQYIKTLKHNYKETQFKWLFLYNFLYALVCSETNTYLALNKKGAKAK